MNTAMLNGGSKTIGGGAPVLDRVVREGFP